MVAEKRVRMKDGPISRVGLVPVVDYRILPEIIDIERKHGSMITVTGGVYDLAHRGHFHQLRMAKRIHQPTPYDFRENILIVNLNTDQRVVQEKGSTRPYQKLEERMDGLSHLVGTIDFITSYPLDDAGATLELAYEIGPDIIVASPGYWTPSRDSATRRYFEKNFDRSVSLRSVPRVEVGRISSTTDIEREVLSRHRKTRSISKPRKKINLAISR